MAVRKPRALILLEFLLFRLFTAPIRHLPSFMVAVTGRVLGAVAWSLPPLRKLTLRNLDLAYGPAMGADEKRRIGRASLVSMCTTFLEITALEKLKPSDILANTELADAEALDRAAAEGRGVIVCAPHYGNWEWLALHTALRVDRPVYAIVRPLDNPLLDAEVRRIRGEKKLHLLDRGANPRRTLEALRQGAILGIMADQNAAVGGVFVPFFGRAASTLRGASWLAARSGAPVFCGWDTPLGGGRHRLTFEGPFRFTGDAAADMATISGCFERVIRARPEAWLWVHPRWKKRPDGEPWLYPGLRV